jgi:hypothetical protein
VWVEGIESLKRNGVSPLQTGGQRTYGRAPHRQSAAEAPSPTTARTSAGIAYSKWIVSAGSAISHVPHTARRTDAPATKTAKNVASDLDTAERLDLGGAGRHRGEVCRRIRERRGGHPRGLKEAPARHDGCPLPPLYVTRACEESGTPERVRVP